MEYVLPDGQKVDLGKVKEISAIRDMDVDITTIDKSLLAFSIRMKGGQNIQVKEYYHFSDWADASKKLKSIRTDLVAALHHFKESKHI